MNEAQSAAYVNAQATCATIEAMGMAADNAQHSEDQPFSKKDFDALIEKYGIYHNSTITTFNGAEVA